MIFLKGTEKLFKKDKKLKPEEKIMTYERMTKGQSKKSLCQVPGLVASELRGISRYGSLISILNIGGDFAAWGENGVGTELDCLTDSFTCINSQYGALWYDDLKSDPLPIKVQEPGSMLNPCK